MNTSQQTGGLRHALRRLRHSERGQGLVEYALIIVVVSLGAIASLTFLRDEIRNLFSRAGSSLAIGGAVGSGPPPTPAPPANTQITVGNTTARSNIGVTTPVWRTTAFSCTYSSLQYHCVTPFSPPAGGGLFALVGGTNGSACSFTYSNGYTFSGHWTTASGLPLLPAWNATSVANLFVPDYGAACLSP